MAKTIETKDIESINVDEEGVTVNTKCGNVLSVTKDRALELLDECVELAYVRVLQAFSRNDAGIYMAWSAEMF